MKYMLYHVLVPCVNYIFLLENLKVNVLNLKKIKSTLFLLREHINIYIHV